MSKKRKRDPETLERSAGTPADLKPPKSEKDKSKPKKDRNEQPESFEKSEAKFASLANVAEIDSSTEGNVVGLANDSMEVDEPVAVKDAATGSDEKQSSKKDKNKKRKDEDLSTGHLSILSKFDKYRAEVLASGPKIVAKEVVSEEPLQGLHPLPQPAQAPVQKVDPNSVLPSYLSQPTTVLTSQRPPFESFGLPELLLSRLEKLGFKDTFPVQSALLPLLLPDNHLPPSTPRSDLLVSAATGSGKTLSYLLPILASLINRIVPHTYALIIVPTHELATQVQRTAHSLAAGTSLKISTAIGTRSFEIEKDHIIANDIGSTGADILIATPGRLVEHIRNNPQFTLRHLQWLVVDEADRLLSQSFQDWVEIVGDELQKSFSTEDEQGGFDITSMGLRTPKRAADTVRKVILSATMTRDVGRLAGLKLRRPQLIAVDDIGGQETAIDGSDNDGEDQETADKGLRELNSLPSTLEEHYYPVSNPTQKPLILAKLLSDSRTKSGILVFTKSNESASRLARLLELLFAKKLGKKRKGSSGKDWRIAVSTSDKRKKEISANTSKFKASAIDILISTDLMGRGVDLPNAQLVINYDSPRNEKDYIHRVGRTARAGNKGITWSLVEDSEARWWWAGIGKVRRSNSDGINKESAPELNDEALQIYEGTLEKLGKEVRGS
ncbi:ATP-dependent RNA helicase dbp6 [Orbilia oligospora]|uniref:ATP-dependent RNA helicase n=1 Tax=Orbilia oligospora TaxID=2813651 RepID=A0A6G1MA91_ORBOL|nr:ATP-dependent RNA helicase dbp6 [Orbilia oligospora]KAF3218466.1 ATP-dependent RNA helicase dbp6 [Orbilia oligospora]KAF3249532.1 ATP-dependent RNA helicase dbp6 [Orbilia oligospora]